MSIKRLPINLTKRTQRDDDDDTKDPPTTKRHRTDINAALIKAKFKDLMRVPTEVPITTVHRLLTRNLTLTDEIFAEDEEGHPTNAASHLLLRFFRAKLPGSVAELDLDAHLAPTQALHLKELIALALIRKWIYLSRTPPQVYLLPLFANEHLPQYKSFFAEEVLAGAAPYEMAAAHWNVVKAAYATNNILLLQWCLYMCGNGVMSYTWFDEALTSSAAKYVYEETMAWVMTNVAPTLETSEPEPQTE